MFRKITKSKLSIQMINFIQNQVEIDKIMIYILYEKVGDKLLPNAEKKIFLKIAL